jgi:hypothetical protein
MVFILHDRRDLDDVGVSQELSDFGFMEKQPAVLGTVDILGQQELHGEVPMADQLDHFPDLAGMSCRQQVLQAVTSDLVLGD